MARRVKSSRKRRTRRKRLRGGSQNYIFVDMMNDVEGLGNQLNLYCVGLVVQKKINLPLCMIRYSKDAHTKNDYAKLFDGALASDLNISPERVKAADIALPEGSGYGAEWSESDIIYNPSNTGKDYRIHGDVIRVPFLSYKPIYTVFPQVKDMLMKNEFSKDAYKKYKDMINNRCAFIHIRKGDFKEKGWNLHEDYYGDALSKMNTSDKIDTIYMFSNDIKWCKEKEEKWKKATSKKLIYDDTRNELEILYMMSLCTAGAILSASMFSSWGAYLGANTNPDSLIIYKYKVIQEKEKPNPYQYPERWVGL